MSTSKPTVTGTVTGGGRDDCWSEGATEVLIEAWGERHLRSNRGNLRQNDWREVSSAVNTRASIAGKSIRSDIQCKNRIDTIKKKYKIEKAKTTPSNWKFFRRFDFLISNPNPNPNGNGNAKARLNLVESTESSLDDDELFRVIGRGRKRHKFDRSSSSAVATAVVEDESTTTTKTTAFKELAKAISSFGEIYERIECSKQELVMELEKERMELFKEMEIQRMNMFVDAQLRIQRLKRSKVAVRSSGKNS